MSNDVILPKEYALVLLRKFAADDLYRSQYEKDPHKALLAIGVPADFLSQLPPGSLAPVTLGPKNVFQEALYQLIDNIAVVCLCLQPPHVNLAVGAPAPGSGRTTTPFGAS